jgi:DNA (cytosine-5)-methyltransferase 1
MGFRVEISEGDPSVFSTIFIGKKKFNKKFCKLIVYHYFCILKLAKIMQSLLFEEDIIVEKTIKSMSIAKHRSGTKDAISRYSNLKMNLNNDKIYNENWFEVDTMNVSDSDSPLNFIDLFSGAGGISVGVKSAGFNKIASVEIDNDASNTIRKNFPESVHFEMPIENLSEEMLDKALNGRKVDVIFGGPPCQGFSVAGLRNPNDPRN